jgi:hypothetical protein
MALVIVSGLVSMRIPVGKTSPHDLDVPLSSGAHIYVDYDSGYSADEKRVTNGNLTLYLPLMANEFWMIHHDAIVTMKRSGGTNPDTGWGAINYDAGGNVVSYSGEVNISSGSPILGSGYVASLLHEWTHVFQFWIPNYVNSVGPHIEGVANAFASALILKELGWDSPEYATIGSNIMTMGQLVSGSSYGLATYLRAIALGGHGLSQGWEEIWYHDRQAFRKFNTLIASLPSGSPVNFREVVRRSLFEGYADYAYDGLSVDDWLNAFSFYSSISDVPEGSKMTTWDASPWTVFEGLVSVRSGTQASVVPISSYDIVIHDGQTHEALYSKTRQPAFCSSGLCSIVVFNNGSFPMRDLLRIDAVAHIDGGDVPVVAYIAARHNDHGDRVIFFLNRDGYAEGSGSSNVGAVQNGLVRWTSGDNVEATVAWSGGTYTYVIENVMAHPAMRMHQIALPLYESRTRLSPLTQTMDFGNAAQFAVHLSPKVSTGTITIYSSTNQADWMPMTSAKPADGLASFSLAFSETGTHYLKATWSGDETMNPSESSIVTVTTQSVGQATIRGNVFSLNKYGNRVPVEDALVVATSGSTQLSAHTEVDGSFQMIGPPGTYDIIASAPNVDPSIVDGHVYQSVQDMIPVTGVNVTAEPLRTDRDRGGSAATDSSGFFSLTVLPFESLQASSSSQVLTDGAVVALDLLLAPTGPAEPGTFVLKFSHSLYAASTQTLMVMPGQSVHMGDNFLNNGPPSAVTARFQGNDYTSVVNTNASAAGLLFDSNRRLINFTITGADETIGSFVVVTPKALLDGTPVVFVDNLPVASTYRENNTHFIIRFDHMLSTHAVTVGGSNTIPEFPLPSLVALSSTLITVILRKRGKPEHKMS